MPRGSDSYDAREQAEAGEQVHERRAGELHRATLDDVGEVGVAMADAYGASAR